MTPSTLNSSHRKKEIFTLGDSDFDGEIELNINESAQRVTAVVTLESNVTSFTDGDVTLTSLEGGQCANDIIDTIAQYIGIGDTYTFLNQNLELVGDELVESYTSTLEANIEAECSR